MSTEQGGEATTPTGTTTPATDRIGRDEGTGNGPRAYAPGMAAAVATNRRLLGLPPQDAENAAQLLLVDDAPAGYIVAGPEHGRLVADWDGDVHETREAGDAALAECHAAGWPDWRLYALTPVSPTQSGR